MSILMGVLCGVCVLIRLICIPLRRFNRVWYRKFKTLFLLSCFTIAVVISLHILLEFPEVVALFCFMMSLLLFVVCACCLIFVDFRKLRRVFMKYVNVVFIVWVFSVVLFVINTR